MAINTSGILKSPQGSAIQNAEIIFEQTRTSTEVLAGTKFSVITNQTGNYSSSLGVGIYVFKVRFQDETQYRTVASNVIVTQSMNNYSLNQIIQDQSQLQDVDYDLLQDVIQARDQAAASAQAAQTSQATATTKASEASSSAQAALASKNAAQTSETNALASKNQAQTSQTNAANSQTAAAGSQTTASTKAGEASTSQTNAAASQTTATTKAGEASSSQTAAASSQSTATAKATEATNSATLAQKWAANPENSVVSGGLYSALHYAAKAAQSAQTASGQLVWRGGWSAQAGTAPPTPAGSTQDFYRITQAGTILSVQYEVGDYIHWDTINSIWFKMDGTDSVTSVNGRTGAVVVTKTDVGLSAVNNWGASSQTNDASTTTYATTAGVKAAYDLAATKLTATANAVSATKLVTPRTINGTSFDGTASITTQNWGTSRNLTIGETAKAVNGSADVSWTLAEIGAIPATLLPTGSNYQDVVSKLIRVGSDGVQEVGRILDFHAVNSVLDNDVRLTVTNETGAISRGDLEITARTVRVNGNEVYHQGNTSPVALGAVPDTRTVNGKRLNANITITSEDVGTYTKQVIDEQSLKTVTVQAPQDVVAGKYYPIVVSNYGSDHSLFVETRSSGVADPMNYCSFDGQIHNGGWSDTGVYVYGQFTLYSADERQIHSILGSSEAQTAYAIYVEARAFPVNVRVRASANVACTGLDMSYGTTVFAQAVTNPQAGVGTKTRLLAEFQPGNHFYSSNTMVCRAGVETQSTVVVNKDRTDVGSLALGGNVQGYAEIAGKAAGQAGYSYDEGLRYYNDNTWRIGNKKILHDGGGTLLGQLSTTFNNAAPIILDRGTQVGIGYRHSATQTQYLGVDDTGSLRFGPNLSHATNQYVYTTDRKPTAADTGAVERGFIPLGQTLDLNQLRRGQHLRLEQGNYTNGPSGDGTDYAQVLHINGQGDTHVQILGTYNTRKLYWRGFNNSSASGSVPWSQIYHTDFKPTPADIGALQAGATAVAATKLATARTIAGVAFDGTANITLTASNVGAIPISGGDATGKVTATALGVANSSSTSGDGLSLYGWYSGGKPHYGIMFAGTETFGSLGAVYGDWATYFTMSGTADRGWIFKHVDSNVASISGNGHLTLNAVNAGIGVHVAGQRQGDSVGLIRGEVQGGSFVSWRERAAGLLVDCQSATSSAHNIFKATHWGSRHLCAMDVHAPASGVQLALHVGGNNTFTFYENGQFHAGAVYIPSDRRLKSNFKPIESALEKVCALKGQSYDKKTELNAKENTPTTREVGLIAQDVQKVLPEAVNESGEDKLLTISNSAVNALLVEAIKELKAEVDHLRRLIKGT